MVVASVATYSSCSPRVPSEPYSSATNVMGALIRITGMIVATIAVQMVLTGVAAWYSKLPVAVPRSG